MTLGTLRAGVVDSPAMGMAPMGDRYRRPDWVRRVNAMGAAAGSARALVPLDAGAMIDAARTSTGVADPGDLGDGDWEGRLRALAAAIDGGDLHVVGRLMTREEIMRGLRTRFLLGEQRRRDRSVADEVIDAPIVVTGPARSGTTILFELLGLDPGLRTPIATDVLHPAAPPAVDAAARTAMTETEQELWADVQPEFAAIHELRSDLPVECITICMPSFAGNHWAMVLADPGDWAPDIAADLAFHRAVLQSVQHGRPPKRWLLKTPGWLFLLDDLLAAYPDASVIVSHRDPARTMPSTVSTTAMIQWLRTDAIDLDVLSALDRGAVRRRPQHAGPPARRRLAAGGVRRRALPRADGRRRRCHRRRLRRDRAGHDRRAPGRRRPLPRGQAARQARHAPVLGRRLGLRRRRPAVRPGAVPVRASGWPSSPSSRSARPQGRCAGPCRVPTEQRIT